MFVYFFPEDYAKRFIERKFLLHAVLVIDVISIAIKAHEQCYLVDECDTLYDERKSIKNNRFSKESQQLITKSEIQLNSIINLFT